MYSLLAVFGFRSFVSTVRQRLGTLKKIIAMIGDKRGTRQVVQKRRDYVATQLVLISLALIFALFFNVLFPASFVFLGYTFNSWEMANHVFIVYVPFFFWVSLHNVVLHSLINKGIKEHEISTKKKRTAVRGM